MAESSSSPIPESWQSWEAVSPPTSSSSYGVSLTTTNTYHSQGQPPMPDSPSKYVPSPEEFQFVSSTSSTSSKPGQQYDYAYGQSASSGKQCIY